MEERGSAYKLQKAVEGAARLTADRAVGVKLFGV